MKFNWITALITASALAMLALIAFQVRWMQHSQELLEEQFNQRVNLALCNTVEKLAVEDGCGSIKASACSNMTAMNCHQPLDTLLASDIFDQTLQTALHFYQIDLPYRANIHTKDSPDNPDELPPYSCTLNPLLDNDDHYLQLNFEDKESFFLAQMGGMIGSSIFILLFICTIFALATYHLLRQKRMSDLNREFFNHMAHEFRTPLTNIRLAGKMLEKKELQLSDSPYLRIIREEGNHLMEQVEQVLHLARLEKHDFDLQRKETDIGQLLRETVKSMELRQLECRARISLDLPHDPVFQAVDPLHLGNAIRNLLDNAMKYCTQVPDIRLGLQASGRGVELSLRDNGQGWAEAESHKVFEKFYQSRQAPNRKGFGLGLAYVKRVIELHGGSIAVNSSPGAGTRFDISLPEPTTHS
ncbi:sensor histidine kinase [Flavilitoribacter nigricans]|uniref:histidine kinase n=1 Tax=Flavilitoribacter nigricans (strain ATCC 23147 / DSM 23189 / NBRC 102662 / NCIMB 1420 / SS-2) TaxID=1122177 RepID=A0A2D0N9P1_FLAN2|nr:HAMP domain-containing sensor histidine kinase [Flavilitoribacter nigricans]PHN04503.1 hypothetical protein CRP01_21090 [Flavilitoribacter nigricans DSM 23189 = NBRC 102662]